MNLARLGPQVRVTELEQGRSRRSGHGLTTFSATFKMATINLTNLLLQTTQQSILQRHTNLLYDSTSAPGPKSGLTMWCRSAVVGAVGMTLQNGLLCIKKVNLLLSPSCSWQTKWSGWTADYGLWHYVVGPLFKSRLRPCRGS